MLKEGPMALGESSGSVSFFNEANLMHFCSMRKDSDPK